MADDFLPNAGVDDRCKLIVLGDRCKLIVLELRRKESGGKPGEEGIRRGSGWNLDELELGEREAFVGALSERPFSECVRSLASCCVDCRAARWGMPSLEPGEPSGVGLCMPAVSGRRAARVGSVLIRVLWFDVMVQRKEKW